MNYYVLGMPCLLYQPCEDVIVGEQGRPEISVAGDLTPAP